MGLCASLFYLAAVVDKDYVVWEELRCSGGHVHCSAEEGTQAEINLDRQNRRGDKDKRRAWQDRRSETYPKIWRDAWPGSGPSLYQEHTRNARVVVCHDI